MFYWTVGNREIVLTDAEETELMFRAGFTASERIDFFIQVGSQMNPLHARLGKYLEEYAARDAVQFELEFVRRSGSGPEHLPELRALIDAFYRTTGRLRWGSMQAPDWFQGIGPALWTDGRPDAFALTLLKPVRRLFRRRFEVMGEISFLSAGIERFYGNGSSFFLATERVVLRAREDFVQMIEVPEHDSGFPWDDDFLSPTEQPGR
jgi:hypothetical protein